MERLHPGVYIQEISSGVRPIDGVSTSTAAFIGKTQKGPVDSVQLVTNFTEFQTVYGGFVFGSAQPAYLPHAALQYFNNGGQRLYVARVVTKQTGAGQPPVIASVSVADRQGGSSPVAAVTFNAVNPGAWANELSINIADATIDATNQFKLTIKRGNDTIETFDNLSVDPGSNSFVNKVVNALSQYITATSATGDPTATVLGTSVSGAGATTLSDPVKRSLVIEINSDGPRTLSLAGALDSGATIAAAIQTAVRALPALTGANAAAYTSFTATFSNAAYTLTSGLAGRRSAVRVTSAPAAIDAARLLKLGITNGGNEVTGAQTLLPRTGVFALGGAGTSAVVTASAFGFDGIAPTEQELIGGLSRLDAIADVNIVAIPGIGTPTIVDAGTAYCAQRQDCFYIGETGKEDLDTAKAQTFLNSLALKSSFGAVYFPWLKAADPTGQSATPILVPPSGYVAGIYARTDGRRGVWKAPAGTEASVAGAVGVAALINDAQQDLLNPIGVNTIRFFPSAGIVVWGARTLSTASDAEYRYVPVRRLAVFLERSISSGIQWAVFEPNDDNLWASLRLNVGAFMMNMFRSGAFQGETPAQAFFVKCDAETNPQSQIDAGVVNVVIGFAPVRPAEFVVITISQKSADAAS